MKRGYDEFTVLDYDKLQGIVADGDIVDKDIAILSLLSGISEDVLIECTRSEIEGMMQDASFLVEEPDVVELPEVLEYGGFSFSIDDLFSRFSYSQLIDWESSQHGMFDILRVLMVPDGYKYNDGYKIDFSGMSYLLFRGIANRFSDFLDRLHKSHPKVYKASADDGVEAYNSDVIFAKKYGTFIVLDCVSGVMREGWNEVLEESANLVLSVYEYHVEKQELEMRLYKKR